jgi:hypothetical protein
MVGHAAEERRIQNFGGETRGNETTWKQWRTQEFFRWGSPISVEDRGQREWGSGNGSPLVKGFTQFANE